MRQVFLPGIAPKAALVPAVVAAGQVFVSGQVGTDPGTGRLAGATADAQARRALDNLGRILAEAGARPEDVVRVGLFVTRPEIVGELDDAYRAFFGAHLPARSAVTVASLARADFLLEIDAVAVLADQSSESSDGASK